MVMPPLAEWIGLFVPLMNAMDAGPMAPADARCADRSFMASVLLQAAF